MGKGDKKTRRGKIHKGTFGVRRPRKNKLNTTQATTKSKVTKKKGATKKTATKKT